MKIKPSEKGTVLIDKRQRYSADCNNRKKKMEENYEECDYKPVNQTNYDR